MPCPTYRVQSSCRCPTLFYPHMTLIQQGTSKARGIFPHLVVGLALSELKARMTSPPPLKQCCSPIARHGNISHWEFSTLNPQPKGTPLQLPTSTSHLSVLLLHQPKDLQHIVLFSSLLPIATSETTVSIKSYKSASQLGQAAGPNHSDEPQRDLCKMLC